MDLIREDPWAPLHFPARGWKRRAARSDAVAGREALPSLAVTAACQRWEVLRGTPKPGLSYSPNLPEPAGKKQGLVFTKHGASYLQGQAVVP